MVTITVNLSAISGQTVNVNYATADGSATAGSDYTATNGVLTFLPGQISQTFAVTIINNAVVEGNETFFVTLSNPVNATPGAPNPATVTIIDNDQPTVQFDRPIYTVSEDVGAALVTVTLSVPSPFTVTVDYATSDGSATAGSDYTAAGGTLPFAPGQTASAFTIPITDDILTNEFTETVNLTLSNPTNAALGPPNPATLEIVDNDGQPEVSFISTEFSANEGDDGGTGIVTATVAVTLSAPSALAVTVTYSTTDGSATSIPPLPPPPLGNYDYNPVNGALIFAPNQTGQNFVVQVISDTVNEQPGETLTLTLSSPVNATLGATPVSALTIVDDDGWGCNPIGSGTGPEVYPTTPPNGSERNLTCGAAIVVDLGGYPIIMNDDTNFYELVYYELGAGLGIMLDKVIIQVGPTNSGPWFTVFYWGDNLADTNTNLWPTYGPPENNNADLSAAVLYNGTPFIVPPAPDTGIQIDVDARAPADLGPYQYVRIFSPFNELGEAAQVDGLQVIP